MALATYKVLVDWNNDGDFSDSNEDVSANVLAALFIRGANFASQLTGRAVAGTLRINLNNSTGIYNSFLSGGALYGNLLPSRKIQVQAGNTGFPYTFAFSFLDTPIWTGYITKILPTVQSGQARTALIEATGPLGRLGQAKVDVAQATAQRTDQLVDDILDAAGWAADDRDLDEGKTTVTRYWTTRQQTPFALNEIAETEAGWIKETPDGKIAFENRHHRYTATHASTSQATFSDAGGSTLNYVRIVQNDPLPQIFNEFRAGTRIYTVGSLAVLWTHPETGSASPTIDVGLVKTFEARFPNSNSDTNAVGVNEWTTTAATTDMLANAASDGSGTNLTSDIGISVTKTGERMLIQLTNNSTSLAYITKLQARGTPIAESNIGNIVQTDATSITTYGERTYPIPAKWLPSSDEATDYCAYNLQVYKNTLPRLSMTVIGKDAVHMSEIITRDLHDRITVTANSSTGANLGINGEFQIDRIEHTIAPMNHVVQWELSPISGGFGSYWVVGTGVLDSSTRLAY